ncbi:histidine phosphatase family protein [Streptomyces sp. t39]|uniref:histidine phosphatase family protein n=1 Tax=Streptomyces sp. t39 TaxID=1828156 RepID=UPI0011CDCF3B|nr:histidine phosphatase family protein [Streptomyces sp. t39]TXS52676.1 histidine phosphatase family protein [Streptomyces sp. t39]
MTEAATRYLYLARHGEATPDESGLTPGGRRQAELLGRRLRDVPLAAIHHGPLPRAERTAHLIGGQCPGVPLHRSEAAGDYVPHVPARAELPAESADTLLAFLAGATEEERRRGPELARRALESFTGPASGGEDRHELVVTHAFLVAWLVRAALDAPAWRWIGLRVANAALTVLAYPPGRPSSVVLLNDMRHLPEELRWTGFPPDRHDRRI